MPVRGRRGIGRCSVLGLAAFLLLRSDPEIQVADIEDAELIELTHTPFALAGIAAGWGRWLELRLPGRGGGIAGWIWPACFILVGVIRFWYRAA